MFVGPRDLAFKELFALRGGWRRIGDLGDEIGCGGFGNAVYENAQKGDLEEDVESHAESKE